MPVSFNRAYFPCLWLLQDAWNTCMMALMLQSGPSVCLSYLRTSLVRTLPWEYCMQHWTSRCICTPFPGIDRNHKPAAEFNTESHLEPIFKYGKLCASTGLLNSLQRKSCVVIKFGLLFGASCASHHALTHLISSDMRENSSIRSSWTGLAIIALCLFPSHPDLVPNAPFQHRNQMRGRVSPYLPGSRRGRPRGRGWRQSAGTWWNLRGIFSSVLPAVLLCCFYFSPLSLPSPIFSLTR